MSRYLSDAISNLLFFTADGYQIEMQKEYNISWEIVPNDMIAHAFIKNPKGYFMQRPMIEYVDAFTNAQTGLAYYKDKNDYKIESDGTDDYVLSNEIELKQNTQYNLILAVPQQFCAVLFYDRNGNIIGHYDGLGSNKLYEYKFNTVSLKNEFPDAVSFKALTRTDMGPEYAIYSGDSYIEIIVEDGGIINPDIDMYTRPGDAIYMFDPSSLSENNEVSSGGNNFVELDNTKKLHTFGKDDLMKLLFFCFKFDKDGKSYYESNYLKLTVVNGPDKITEDYNLIDFFRTTSNRFSEHTNTINISFGVDDLTDDGENQQVCYSIETGIFTQTLLKDTLNVSDDFSEDERNLYTTAFYVMSENVSVREFPFVHYQGSVIQEPVSTDLISTNTVFILNNNDGNLEYPKITINDGSQDVDFRIVCRFKNDSETTFITSDDNAVINQRRTMNLPLKSDDMSVNEVNDEYAMYFTVGFESSEEGCYQNPMGLFLRNENTDEEYFMGLIVFKNEAVGEDERFRTLLTNFGIPDPIKFPNIFAGLDVEEESTDWTVVNEKSKELFLMYDQIFPYTGTYKALLNAIKYLGYQDLIFKEWYKIKDSNDKNRYVAIQTYNTKTGQSIENILKKYGVSYGEYDRYTKLNRLSMVYHMEEISDDHEEILKIHTKEGLIDSPYYDVEQIPALKHLYNYRTDEVLAKLYSVKKWLEAYITGVNCYISDINGEGIVLERIKVQGYVTENHYKDIQNIGYFTPNAKQQTEFIDSSCIISCSLNEFTNITFADYADYPIDSFIKETTVLNGTEIYVSAPLGAMTVADEYAYDLYLDNPVSGSLYEFSKKENTLLVNDSEITFFENYSEAEIEKLPVISLRKANIRRKDGAWKTNVEYTVKQVIDPKTLNVYYVISKLNVVDGQQKEMRCKGSVILSPSQGATFKYSADNKWQVPVFTMKGFIVSNQIKSDKYNSDFKSDDFIDIATEYIIEVIDGEFKFRNNKKTDKKECDGAVITFAEPYNDERQTEQQIHISYEYKSVRQKIYDFKVPVRASASLNELMSDIENGTTLMTEVKVPVNRLGKYNVVVKAYDAYNNIFTARDDDSFNVSCRTPDIDIILNSENSNNKTDFYKENKNGEVVKNNEKQTFNVKCDEKPVHPITYSIYDAQRDDRSHTINYDVITYAIDTPKKNDYIMLTNMTECVEKIENNNVLVMKQNNYGKQNIYISGGYIDLVVYDEVANEIIHDSNYKYLINEANMDESRLTLNLNISQEILQYRDKINDKNSPINLYVISANSIDLRECTVNNDTKNHMCYIVANGRNMYDYFNADMVVKISVSYNDGTNSMYDNQVAARIIDKRLYNTTEDNIIKLKSLLVIDTEIDIDFIDSLNNKNIYKLKTANANDSVCVSEKPKIIIEPLHQQGVIYTLRVVSDAIEKSVKYYNNEYYTMNASFNYMTSQLMFDEYFDDSYTMKIYDYDPRDLDNIWFDYNNKTQFNTNSILYKYTNYPVSIEQNRYVMIKSGNIDQLDKDYKTYWKWYSYLIEDTDNWKNASHNMNKTLVFDAFNDILTVRPNLLGPQSIEMRCIDKYGNMIVNDNGGNIFLNKSTEITSTLKKRKFIDRRFVIK